MRFRAHHYVAAPLTRLDSIHTATIQPCILFFFKPHSTHRVATAAFWRTYMMVRVGGARPTPFTIFTITYTALQCTLQLSGQIYSPYFISTNICTLCVVTLIRGSKLTTFTDESEIEKVSAAGAKLSTGQLGSSTQLPAG
jgi:hypothetical protein